MKRFFALSIMFVLTILVFSLWETCNFIAWVFIKMDFDTDREYHRLPYKLH